MGIRCHPRGSHAGLVVGHNQPMKIQLLQPCGDMNLDLWVEKQTPLDGYATQQVSMFPLNGIPPILISNRHRRYDNNFLAPSYQTKQTNATKSTEIKEKIFRSYSNKY